MVTSRIPGFYKVSLDERRRMAAAALGVPLADLDDALALGGLSARTADKTIENVIGTYAMPFALALNVQMNGRDHIVPMVVEEPSVVAAASNAARMIRAGGGFVAEADAPIMIAQIQLDQIADADRATVAITSAAKELCELADAAVPNLLARGGGARGVEVRDVGEGFLVVHVLVDCRDAMGANLVNSVAEALGDRVRELAGGRLGLRILSNLADRRMVRVRSSVPLDMLAAEGFAGRDVADGVARASRFAELDPHRAATHNKGIMNGIDPVVIATGNDWRAVEAGAHAFASTRGARGGYGPLCTWKVEGDACVAVMELPLALGTVGGTLRVHEAAQLALEIAGVASAQELGMLAACVGMASNLAALRALATVGIQKGHMALHARSVAIAAGAFGELVEIVAMEIHEAGCVTIDAARAALLARSGSSLGAAE